MKKFLIGLFLFLSIFLFTQAQPILAQIPTQQPIIPTQQPLLPTQQPIIPPVYGPPPPPVNNSSNPACDGSDASSGINTAIGCIPVSDTNEFMGWILGWAVGVGGGIAFLLIVYASFMIMTSQGNPERLKAGQELLTSAISGLILLIFSVFILKFIGVDILGLDELGFN